MYFSGNNIDPKRTWELTAQLIKDAEAKAAYQRDRHVVPPRDDNKSESVTTSEAWQSHGTGKDDVTIEKPYKVMLVVISKSGSTLDAMSNFMVIYDQLKKESLVEVSVVAVTDPAQGEKATLLGRLADDEGWMRFSVPDGVGGRFSIFAEVGLVTAACIGLDIDDFLAGARDMDEVCQSDDIQQNPALLNAALKYLAAEKYGRDIEVFMPYADYLKSTAEWYVQLLAESLGKRVDREGQEIFYGRTPIVAVGTTDMHAQTQQHQDGKKNKVVQFVKVASWDIDPKIPDIFPEIAKLSDISSIHLSQALDAARESNAEALIKDNRC
jgi:glucose-6-phosphate isomerase